ncbi:PaaI family thioesterase [Actinomyces sp.]
MNRMGMRIISQSPERTVIEMPISGNTQPQGLLHGGASAALAETAASHSAILHAQRLMGDNAVAVGVELNISHLKAGRGSLIRATAEALHLGQSSTVHTVRITDEDEQLIAVARVSNRILNK